jgi:hypothetical protein
MLTSDVWKDRELSSLQRPDFLTPADHSDLAFHRELVSCLRNSMHFVAIKMGRRQGGPSRTGGGWEGARSRLEKQPTDLRQNACYFGDRTLG